MVDWWTWYLSICGSGVPSKTGVCKTVSISGVFFHTKSLSLIAHQGLTNPRRQGVLNCQIHTNIHVYQISRAPPHPNKKNTKLPLLTLLETIYVH